jgi:CelD/BcsL family acetyltransferase involved in cellulose biosynthesis
MRGRTITLFEARDPRVEPIWRALEARARPTYFLSWAWVDSWLAALPDEALPRLAVIGDCGAPVAAFFLGHRRERRHVVLASDVMYFNATGSPRHDELCIEHNAPLGDARSLGELVELLPAGWDELVLPAVDQRAFGDLRVGDRFRVRVERESAAPFVDLEAVRARGDYTALLGSSTRAQLRRARRVVGELEVEVASNTRSALDIYSELVRLHARRWEAVGERGAFADPWFERFHRKLIVARLPHDEIQLVRVRAGGVTLGCLYNFIYAGRVLFYQCGLATFDDPHVKPGYLCHAAAIDHAARAGHAIYDLLGGGAYKERLATGTSRLVWLRVQRPLARFALEDYIVAARRRSSARIASALGARNLLPWPGRT